MGLVVLLLWSDLDLSSSSSLLLLHPVCFFSPLLQFYGNSSSTWIILSTSAWNSSVYGPIFTLNLSLLDSRY